MPYLNRRTVRSLLARSRPAPSPVSTRPAETLTDTVKPEPRATLPSSSSAPVGLVETSPSVLSSARAVTANESISPASARSMPANTTNNRASTSTPGESHSSEHTQPLVDAAQHEIAAYLEAGIPIPGAVPAAPPVFAPYVAGHVPASDSPPYEFNGLFAVPTASTSPPATPGAPPLYQPHASDAEVFPQLPFTPFHRNAIVARSGGERVEHELPGDDRFPRYPGSRAVNGSWLGGRFERFTVGGRTFFCPVHLMLRYPHWHLLLNLERPAHGWVLSPSVDATIFALVIEALVSPSGFDGTEPGLNLVQLVLAARQAHDWGMEREVAKLVASARRYVARRVFYRNPHAPDAHGVMDHNYFVHRSEEIFRAWRVASQAPRALQRCLAPAELVCLYTLAVPRDLWPALTAEFPDEFVALIDYSARIRVVPEEVDFHDWWLRFFCLAGCLDFDWMADVPDVLNMFFRGHEEASRELERQRQRQRQQQQATDTDGNVVDGLSTAARASTDASTDAATDAADDQ